MERVHDAEDGRDSTQPGRLRRSFAKSDLNWRQLDQRSEGRRLPHAHELARMAGSQKIALGWVTTPGG
ncbi:MAG: hypothetical protein ACRDHN_08225 [Thermomicrobiales bacterium]